MKKILVLLSVLILIPSLLSAQEQNANAAIEKEVNETVWKPFKKAYDTRDWRLFNSLHTDDMLRVTRSGIRSGVEYKESTRRSYSRPNAPKRTIEFWLEHRIYNGDIGYEVGYYRITDNRPGEETRYFYSRFHIVLKKIDGQWKIAQDWDTNNINGRPVTEEDFKKGTPLSL